MDEKVCPHCGHAIMSWEFDCPGCDQIPKDTPAGRRILARERRQRIFKILLAIVFSAVLFTGLSFVIVKMQYNKLTQVQQHLDEMSGRILHFEHSLKMSREAEGELRQEVKEQAVGWLDIEGPMLLEILHDYADYPDVRGRVLLLITALFHPQSPVREWAPESHGKFVEALSGMAENAEPGSDARRMIGLTLNSIR